MDVVTLRLQSKPSVPGNRRRPAQPATQHAGYITQKEGDGIGRIWSASPESRGNLKWVKHCDPMQLPLPGENGWAEMEQVYVNP